MDDDGTSGSESQVVMSSTVVEESHDEAQTDNVNSEQSVEMPQPAPRKNSKKPVVEEEEEEEEEEDEEFLRRRSKPALKIIVHNEPSATAAPVQSNTTMEMAAQTTKQEWSFNSSVQNSGNINNEAMLNSQSPDTAVTVQSADDLIEKKEPDNVENFTNADSTETEKNTGAMETVEISTIVQENSTDNTTENGSRNENDPNTVIKSEPAAPVDSEAEKQVDKIQNTVENETAVVTAEPASVESEMEKQVVDQIQSDSSAVSQQQNEANIQAEEENAKSVVHIQTEQQQQQQQQQQQHQVSAVEKSDDSKAAEQQRIVVTSTDVGNVQNATELLLPVCSQEEKKAEAPSSVEHVTVEKDVEKQGTTTSQSTVVKATVFSSENEPGDKQTLHNPTSTVVGSKECGDNSSTVTMSKIEMSPIEVSSVKPIHYSSTGSSKLTTEQNGSSTFETTTKQQQHADNVEANQIGSAVSFESTVEDGYRKEVKTETKVSKSPNSSTTTKIISTTVKMEKQGAEAVPNMREFIPAEMANLMEKMEKQHGSSVVFKGVPLIDKNTGKTEQHWNLENTAQKAADQANTDFSKPTSQSTEIPIERVLVECDTRQPTAQKTVTRIEKTRTYMKKVDDPTSWIQQESVAKNNWASSAPWAKSTSTIAMPFPLPDDGQAKHYYKQMKTTTTTTTTRTERSSTTAGAEPKTTITTSETVSHEGKPTFDSWFGTVFVKPDMIRPATVVEHQTSDKSYSANSAKAGGSSFAEDRISTTPVPANVYSTHYSSQSVVEVPPQQHPPAESTNSSRYTSNYSTTQTRSYQTSRPLNWQPSAQQQQQQHQAFTEAPFSSHDQYVDRSWMGQQAKMPFAENANQSYSKSTYHSSQRSILKEQPALSTQQWQQHTTTVYGNQLTGQPGASQSKLFLGKMPGRMTTKWPPSNFTVHSEQEHHFHSSENSGIGRTNWPEDVGHGPQAGQQQRREEVGQQRQAPSTTGGSFWTVTTTRHHTSTAR